MNVREFQETFSPWFDVVTKKFQGSFSEDYDINILAFLHENIDREIKLVFSSTDKHWTTVRTQTLYNVLTYLYEHILWKLRKEDFPNASLSCVKLLSQLIKTGLLLTYGRTECEYIDRILTALKLFTGKPALLYDALLLVNGLKKLQHEPYSVILRCVLKTDHKEITDPLLYMEIILLFRRLRALSDSSDKTLYSLAKKMKPPSNLISWLVSLKVNGSISFLKLLKHKKILHQLMKKNIPESLLKTVRHMILRSYYFEESCNPHKEMIISGNTSDLFIIDTSSLVTQEIQAESSHKNLKKINSKKLDKNRIKKSTKGLVSAKKEVCDKKLKESTVSEADSNVFYIDNFSNLVIENEQSNSLQGSDSIETHFISNSAAQTSKTVSANTEECKNSSKKIRKSKCLLNTSLHNEEHLDSLQESDATETHLISNLAAQTSKTVSANIEECKNSSKKRRKSKHLPNTSLHNEELNEHFDSLQESDAIETHLISSLAAQTSKTESTNIEEINNSKKKKRKSKHISNTSLHNEELNEHFDSLQESNAIQTHLVSNLAAQTSKTESTNIEEINNSKKKKRKSKHIPNTSLHNEELNEYIENKQSDLLQEIDTVETHFISNLETQTAKTVSANVEECKNSSQKRRKSKRIPNASLHNEALKNSEVEIVNLVDTESSDNGDDIPVKKSKKEYEIDRISGRKETPCQRIPSKRDYSENESLEYSAESENTKVKHRKKIKYTDDKTVNEYSLETCNISSESNFENFDITPNEVEKPIKNSSDNSVDQQDVTFVAEVIRNARKALDMSKINKQISVKFSETSEKLQNVTDKDDSAFITDNNELCDHQAALLESQIPSTQTSSPPKLPDNDEDSKKSDQNSDVEVAENKEASSKLSSEDISQNTSNHSINRTTDENTDITPKQEQSTLSSIIEANQDSSHSSPSSDTCSINKAVETHIEKEKLSSSQLSTMNELAINENFNVKCNDSINTSHSSDKSVENSHEELLETGSRFTQTLNKESEISHKCSDNDYSEKVISLSSKSSPASKDILEKENELSPGNTSKSQKISDLNPKVAFQSDIPCNKFDSVSPSVYESDVKQVDQKNSIEVIKEIEIPDSSNTSSSTSDVIPFVEVNKNSHETSKDNSACNNFSKQSLSSNLITKNKELIAEDANSLSSSPLSDKCRQGNSALSIAPNSEIQKDKGQILSMYDNDSNFKDFAKELSNEGAVNSKNCLSTDNISKKFNQSVNDVECENTASKDEVKFAEKSIPQVADSSTNSSKVSELSDSNNKDFVNSSPKNTGEAILEINTKCKISDIDVKQSIENSPTKNFTSEVKCSERSNNTEKIVSVLTPSISSKTNEKVFEKSLQEDPCLLVENSSQSSLVALQNDKIIEKVLPNPTDSVPENDLKPEKIAVDIMLQNDKNSDSLLQDHTKPENIVKDLVTESSIQNNSSNVPPKNDKTPQNIIQSDEVESASQNEECIPSQDDTKFENVFQEDNIANNSSQLNSETDSMSLNDNKSDNIVESACQTKTYNQSHDDTKSENDPQKAVTENCSQQDTETVSVSQDDKKSENIVEDDVKVQTTSQNDTYVSQDDTKAKNILEEDLVAEGSSQKNSCVSQDDTKAKNILDEDLVAEGSSQKNSCVSQEDVKTKNILEEDLVAESSSHDDPNSLSVPHDDKKYENIIPGDSVGSASQNESSPQDDTESGNIFQVKIAKCTSQIDQEIDSGSQEDKIVENTPRDFAEVESTHQNEACSPSCNKEKSENNLHEVAEKSSNDSKTISEPQKDRNSKNKEIYIQEIDSGSQEGKIVENTPRDFAEVESTHQNEACSPSCNKKKSENNLHEVAEKSSSDSKTISEPQKDRNSKNKAHVDSEIESICHNDGDDDPKTISSLAQIDKKSESIVQCDADEETVLQNNAHILSSDKKSENILHEDLSAESSSQNDSYSNNVTQDDKKSEDLIQSSVEVVNKSQNEICSVSHEVAKPENILHEKIVVETSLQSVPNTNNMSEEGEKSKNIVQSDIKGRISPQNDAKACDQSQKNTESKTISQADTNIDSLTQDKLQSINKFQVIKEVISGCPSNTLQCDIPNLTNKTVMKDNLSSYSVLNTSNPSNICDISKNVEYLPSTKDSVFKSETDSEEIDVVNISNESESANIINESEASITKTECSINNADTIKEFSSVVENESNSKLVKCKQLSKESIGKDPVKSMPKAVLPEYTPHFCKNKDYVSFSDISLQNKNKIIVLDSGLKNPNPISNFSLAATAEIFCEYRNDVLHGDKTDVLSRDDALSNTHLSDFTKSPSLSSSGSDEESDSPTYSSTEDNLTNETEKTDEDKSNTVAARTSDSSSSLKNNSCPASENETDDMKNVQNENECAKPSTSDGKEPNERLLVRQSLRLQIKAEAKNKVCLDENPEADELPDKESKSAKELNPEVDESSHKDSKSAKEVADSVSHKISSPKNKSISCDDIIPSSASSNCISSEDKTSSQKSVSTKSTSVSKRKSKIKAKKDYVSPSKGYSLRHRKSRRLIDDSSNLGIDLTKLKLDSSCSMSTRSKSSTKDIKFAKLLTSELNSQKSSDSNELTLPTKRETRSSSAKTEPDATQSTPGYNLRTRTSIIAPGKLKI